MPCKGRPQAFAFDRYAVPLAKLALQRGANKGGRDAVLSSFERLFLLMPLEHSEYAGDHAIGVECAKAVLDDVQKRDRPTAAYFSAVVDDKLARQRLVEKKKESMLRYRIQPHHQEQKEKRLVRVPEVQEILPVRAPTKKMLRRQRSFRKGRPAEGGLPSPTAPWSPTAPAPTAARDRRFESHSRCSCRAPRSTS